MSKNKKNYAYFFKMLNDGYVPTKLNELFLSDRKGNSIAHEMARRGHVFTDPRILSRANGKKVTVLEIMLVTSPVGDVSIPHDLTELFLNNLQKDTKRYNELMDMKALLVERIENNETIDVSTFDEDLFLALTTPQKYDKTSTALRKIMCDYVPKDITVSQCEEFWKLGITFIYNLAIKYKHPVWRWDLPEGRFRELYSRDMRTPIGIPNMTYSTAKYAWKEYLIDLNRQAHRYTDTTSILLAIEEFGLVGEMMNSFDGRERMMCPTYGTTSEFYKMLCNLPDDILTLTLDGESVLDSIVSLFEYLPDEFMDIDRDLNGFPLMAYLSKDKKLIKEGIGDETRIRIIYIN